MNGRHGMNGSVGGSVLRDRRLPVVGGVLLALMAPALWSPSWAPAPSDASAGRDAPIMPPNAAQQRKDMIEALEAIDARLKKLEAAVSNGLEVRVVNFPEPTNEDKGSDRDRADRASRE